MAVPSDETVTAAPTVADPAPLGLAGFALTTFILTAIRAGWMGGNVGDIWLGMALFYGGLAQFMAGMWEFRRNNTFGATAFTSYGAFWMGFAILITFSTLTKAALGAANPNVAVSFFLFSWMIFTAYMTIAALRTNGGVLAVFVLLTLTYLFLWLGAMNNAGNGHGLTQIGGFLGILTAIAAWYASFAGVVNSTWGRVVFPVFPLTP